MRKCRIKFKIINISDKTTITKNSYIGTPRIKRQRSNDVCVPNGKLLQQFKSLTLASIYHLLKQYDIHNYNLRNA